VLVFRLSTDKVCIFRLIPPSLCCSASRHDADVNKRMRQRFQEAATYMCFSASYCALVPDHIRPFPLDHTCMSLCLHLNSMGGNKESAKKDKESTKQEEDQKEGTATPSRKALKAAYVKLKNLTLKIGVYLCVCVRARVCARVIAKLIFLSRTHRNPTRSKLCFLFVVSLFRSPCMYHNCISILTHLSTYLPICLFLY